MGASLLLCAATASTTMAVDLSDVRLLSDPALSRDHVAFQYAGDLWIADRDGSGARRITSHEGSERLPRFSPDGGLLAFSAQYDGNTDVFAVAGSGGVPQRLTWHPDPDFVEDWSPDGQRVLFASQRATFTRRHIQLFEIPADPSSGVFPAQLPIPHGLRASYSPDGAKIAYVPLSEAFHQWKNYRGGTTSRIWIYDVGDQGVVQVPQPIGRCNDTMPVWVGERVFFRSDRAGEFNLFSWDTSDPDSPVQQHTDFDDFPILAVQGDGESIVFEQAGYLHLYTPGASSSQRLRVSLVDDLDERRPRWVDGDEWIRSAGLSPGGQRAVFEYRGEILTLPAKKGDVRNLTGSSAVHERSPAWSPDGRHIAYFSDRGGEYSLHVEPQDGSGEPRIFELASRGGAGFYEHPSWSPDGDKLSFIDNSWALFVLDLERDELIEVAREPSFGPEPLRALEHDWSPDSRWLAYTLSSEAAVASAWIWDSRSGASTRVTDGLSDVAEPAFDRSSKDPYLLASTDPGPVNHWFSMSNPDMERTSSVYVVVLAEGEPSPLAPQSDEVELADEGAEGEDGADSESEEGENGENGVAAVVIDFERLDERIVALPMAPANYGQLQAADGALYVLRQGSDASGGAELVRYDIEGREEEALTQGVQGFALSPDRSHLLWATASGWGISPLGQPIDPGEQALDVGKLRVRVDPPAEWAQILREVWRINRDYFYDPNMHGADWDAIGETYSEFLSHLTTRADLGRVLEWMLSELAVGHSYLGGGDARTESDSVPGGLLGADWEISSDRYRIRRLYPGLNWNPELRSPLTEPGVGAREGEYLIAVNSAELTSAQSVYAPFEGTAGRSVEITLASDPRGEDARTVRVTPVASEAALRSRAWVEGNLRRVHEATDGRVAYVWVPNTAGLGHEYFKRYFYPQVDKQAIIVDERFNGGGQVADYVIDHLRREHLASWATRYGRDLRTPSAAIDGPKVMLIDETAGSGGDLLPWMFRRLELGTLVGKRTWGGLVGILGFPVLIDGGFVTAPNLAFWTEEGFGVENVGVPPDVEVEQWPAEVAAGRDPQLEKAIEIVLEQLEASPPSRPVRPPFPVRVRTDEP